MSAHPSPANPPDSYLPGSETIRLGPRARDRDMVAALANVKLLLLDLDGTVFHGPHDASIELATAIGMVQARGVRCAGASGRWSRAMLPTIHALRLQGPHIGMNGAVVFDSTGKVLQSTPIQEHLTAHAIEILDDAGLRAEYYSTDTLWVTNDSPKHAARFHHVCARPERDQPMDRNGILRINVVVWPGKQVADVFHALAALGLEVSMSKDDRLGSGVQILNVTAPSVNKGTTALYIAQQLGLAPAEIGGGGDGGNDLPLLRVAGASFLMGQSEDEHEADGTPYATAADLILPPIGDDGLVDLIEFMSAQRT